jgi:hypothetical protein
MAEKSKAIPFRINNVEALWPRINTTYKFDNKQKRSVQCDPFDDGASYEISFRMTKDQAKELFTSMKAAYKEKSEGGWPDKFDNPFKKDAEDGSYTYKARLKGAYGKDATRKPAQYDAANTKLADDFLLTTGSTVNIAGVFYPYHNNSMGTGVSLRLNAVQVIKYVPMQMSSPFEATEGFEAGEASPFASNKTSEADELEDDLEDEVKEPKKVVKKASAKKAKDPELDAIVDDWDD